MNHELDSVKSVWLLQRSDMGVLEVRHGGLGIFDGWKTVHVFFFNLDF